MASSVKVSQWHLPEALSTQRITSHLELNQDLTLTQRKHHLLVRASTTIQTNGIRGLTILNSLISKLTLSAVTNHLEMLLKDLNQWTMFQMVSTKIMLLTRLSP